MTIYIPTEEDRNLIPLAVLLGRATVDEDDRQKVAKDWRTDPPDESFDGLLDAEIVDD